jgi:hypothetical protein
MTSFDWSTAIAECCTHLAGLGNLPPPAAQDPALQALAVLSLTADTGIAHALTPASTIPILTIPRYAGRHDLVDDLLAELTRAVARPSHGSFHHTATNWIVEHGLDALVLRSVQHTADDTGRAELLAHAAQKARDFMKEQDRLQHQHMRALLERDAPDLADEWQHFVPDILAWILAHEYDGDATRAIRVQRRLQTLRLYAGLAKRLREPAITEVIDGGGELVPVLAERLAITRPQLRALREASPPDTSRHYLRHNFEHAVRHLQAHAVPLHQWPGRGWSGQHAAWQSSPWLTTDEFTLIRADYYGSDVTTVRDAVRGFIDDLLAPLLAELKSPAACTISPSAILRSLDTLAATHLPAIQQFLACIRRALVGERGPKAFQKAAHVWHRRAAAVIALRNENQTDRPGWPPLCPPWTSPCGHYQILPLTTAKALVEEGNAHHHCVGTYYDACRSGGTQILSLREGGKPMVTAEILLDANISSLRVGQFKGLYDEVPDDPALHQTMRDCLRDLRTGAHPLNRQELRAYRQWADEHIYGWSERPLSIAHARQAFPLYLPLLPRGSPADFDLWCDATGLKEGLRNALRLLTPRPESRLKPQSRRLNSKPDSLIRRAACRSRANGPLRLYLNPRRPIMGWLYQHDPIDNPLAYLTGKYTYEDDWHTLQTLDGARVGNTVYLAVKSTDKKSGRSFVLAVVILISNTKRYGFGYKDMDEAMGPCECACPERIIRLLSPVTDLPHAGYAADWRARSRPKR